MTGTECATVWEGNLARILAFLSPDLDDWEGPVEIFRVPDGFLARCNYWAPELPRYPDFYLRVTHLAIPFTQRWSRHPGGLGLPG